jgi:eukaryotic-like serine/threonine-protein kinase
MIAISRRSVFVCAALLSSLVQCGSPPEPVHGAAPSAELPRAHARAPAAAEPARLGEGSSDGTTCEEARDSHPDEVGPGAKQNQGAELPDDQLSGPLSRGSYLNDCEVPEHTRVNVCAAIADGKAVGVTVATSPSDPEKERCVSGKIREIPFPSHPRLRVVRTSF